MRPTKVCVKDIKYIRTDLGLALPSCGARPGFAPSHQMVDGLKVVADLPRAAGGDKRRLPRRNRRRDCPHYDTHRANSTGVHQ